MRGSSVVVHETHFVFGGRFHAARAHVWERGEVTCDLAFMD
jgi:hypothetical protein